MIDLDAPESKTVRILAGEPICKARGRGHLEIVQDDDCADRCVVHGHEERMLALRRVRWAVDQDQMGAFQALERFALRGNVERLDRPKTVPATSQRNDLGMIRFAALNRLVQLFSARQPVRRIFDTGCAGGNTAQRMGRASRTEFERRAPGRQERGYLFEEPATVGRENPCRNVAGGGLAVVRLNETVQLRFERGICGSLVGFSDNPSGLLSAFRDAVAVSARF